MVTSPLTQPFNAHRVQDLFKLFSAALLGLSAVLVVYLCPPLFIILHAQ